MSRPRCGVQASVVRKHRASCRTVAAAIGVIALAGSPALSVAASETPTSAVAKSGQGMTDAQIQTDLQSEGYGDVRITGRTWGHVDVTATRNGLLQKFAVDPHTGAKVPDADAGDD
jgi:hypothetical protein